MPRALDTHDIYFGCNERMGLHRDEAHHVTGRIEKSQHRQFVSSRDVALNRRWYPEPFREGFEHFAANGPAPLENGSRAGNSSQHYTPPAGMPCHRCPRSMAYFMNSHVSVKSAGAARWRSFSDGFPGRS